jgi:hypothetical protein
MVEAGVEDKHSFMAGLDHGTGKIGKSVKSSTLRQGPKRLIALE